MSSSINCLRSLAAISIAALLTVTAHAQTVVVTNNTTGNFDASSGSRLLTFSALDIGAGGLITDVNISINFAKADGESFSTLGGGTPFYNETVFNLTYGATTTALISENSFNPGSGPGFSGIVTFDDAATDFVNVNVNLIQAGTFKPIGLLSSFNGLNLIPGDWSLFIQDTVGADSLRFYSATLEVTYQGGPIGAVPEPSTYGLMGGAALLGGVLLRRRFKASKS